MSRVSNGARCLASAWRVDPGACATDPHGIVGIADVVEMLHPLISLVAPHQRRDEVLLEPRDDLQPRDYQVECRDRMFDHGFCIGGVIKGPCGEPPSLIAPPTPALYRHRRPSLSKPPPPLTHPPTMLLCLRRPHPQKPSHPRTNLVCATALPLPLPLPSGCGKSLIGFLVAERTQHPFLVLTTRFAEQWAAQLARAYTANGAVVMLDAKTRTSDIAGKRVAAVITTYHVYHMLRDSTVVKLIELMLRGGGIVVLDEVHVAAAPCYLDCVRRIRTQGIVCVGLTATLVREDDELPKLVGCIGDVRASISRKRLVAEGHVMDVACTNIVLPCAATRLLPQIKSARVRSALLALALEKELLLSIILKDLAARGHRVIVFVDDLQCLEESRERAAENAPGVPILGPISMHTPPPVRERLLQRFRTSERACVLWMSRTGDDAMDVPVASAVIMLWHHWASRRQHVQRLGRISRPSEQPSVAYVLLSNTRRELQKAKHRDGYLAEHGFAPRTVAVAASEYGAAFGEAIGAAGDVAARTRTLLRELLARMDRPLAPPKPRPAQRAKPARRPGKLRRRLMRGGAQ